LKKLGNNYVILYPKLTYLPFLKNQIAFLYDLPLEKRYLINSVNLKENIQKEFDKIQKELENISENKIKELNL
ncbi:MAG: hypothetical protein ACP5IC_02805, partial [Minisyncoccia bacterium]